MIELRVCRKGGHVMRIQGIGRSTIIGLVIFLLTLFWVEERITEET
jgi:hypothetical protein